VSLEQTPGELMIQTLARFSQIETTALTLSLRGETTLTPEQDARFVEASEKIAQLTTQLRLHGRDRAGGTIEHVIASAIRSRFDAVFVDHLGMIGRGTGEKFGVLEHAVDRLRGLARGEALAGYMPFVCALSPLNRQAERQAGDKPPMPTMADFAGSSQIESDADAAMILRKRRQSEGYTGPDVIDCWVLKNRQGRSGCVLPFEGRGATCTITELVTDREESNA